MISPTAQEVQEFISLHTPEYIEEGFGTPIKHFGQWAVTDYGLTCMPACYTISIPRVLSESLGDEKNYGWLWHMSCKGWVNMGDFLAGWYYIHDHFGAKKSC